jgi:O-antigen ligase
MISIVLASLYLLFFYGRRKIALTVFLSAIIALSIAVSSVAVIYKKYPLLASTVYRVAEKEQLAKEPTLITGHRYAAFKANWAMFLDHPILGVGPFMAMYAFNKYKPFGYDYPNEQLASHNQYLQLLSEKGIFGFIIFLGFIFIMIKNINRFIKYLPPGNEYKALLIGFKSAIFVYLISSLVLETSYELQFWLIIGLSMALLNIIKKEHVNA